MSYQFAHIESYARMPGKGKTGGHSVRSIMAEAGRELDACPHVEQPAAPIELYGRLADVERRVEAWAAQFKDTTGRKLRKDGLCLLAGVISYPSERDGWERYRDSVLDELKKEYGERLVSVIEHTDEAHPHIHYYCVPLPGERFDVIHPGRRAAAEVKAAGGLKGEQNEAYKAAMRNWQDELYERCSIAAGLTRIGPGRRRLKRNEHQTEKAVAELIAGCIARTASRHADEIKKVKTRARTAAVEASFNAQSVPLAEYRRLQAKLEQVEAEAMESREIVEGLGLAKVRDVPARPMGNVRTVTEPQAKLDEFPQGPLADSPTTGLEI